MITAYLKTPLTMQAQNVDEHNKALLEDALWVDLYHPAKEEQHLVEETLQLEIPAPEDMQEIEISSRLYKENNTLFMTVTMVAKSNTDEPKNDPVTFILSEKQLITVRYLDPLPFQAFSSRIARLPQEEQLALNILLGLLESAIDRIADILEIIGHNLDNETQKIFRPTEVPGQTIKSDFRQMLKDIGRNGDLCSKSRESLVSFNRLLIFLNQMLISKLDNETQFRLSTLTKDVTSLSDHVSFLSSKINFLLDATLGMINIEQNTIIKIFSVAAVIFLPPTLIASIYGMNFKVMPELSWTFGYPMALGLMLLSAWLPYKYFKRRKWL